MLMVYGLGVVFTLLPDLYQNYIRGQTEREFIQAAALPNGYKLICGLQTNEQSAIRYETVVFTMRAMSCLSLLSLAGFKLVQGQMYAPFLWLELKSLNYFLLTGLSASLITFHYPMSLLIALVMVVQRFATCLVPMPQTYDFSLATYALESICCVFWLLATMGGAGLLLFGTLLGQTGFDQDKIQERVLEMAQAVLLDYECAGSRFWLIVAALVVPNGLILFKILSN